MWPSSCYNIFWCISGWPMLQHKNSLGRDKTLLMWTDENISILDFFISQCTHNHSPRSWGLRVRCQRILCLDIMILPYFTLHTTCSLPRSRDKLVFIIHRENSYKPCTTTTSCVHLCVFPRSWDRLYSIICPKSSCLPRPSTSPHRTKLSTPPGFSKVSMR